MFFVVQCIVDLDLPKIYVSLKLCNNYIKVVTNNYAP